MNYLKSSNNSEKKGNLMFMAPDIYEPKSNKKLSREEEEKDLNNFYIKCDLYSLGLLLGYIILGQGFEHLVILCKSGGKSKLISEI